MDTFKYKVHDLYNPTLTALHSLGGSASVSEIEDFVIEFMKLTEYEVNDIHRGTATKLNYRLRWTRNHLKHFGLLENEVIRVAHNLTRKASTDLTSDDYENENEETTTELDQGLIDAEISWQEEALEVIKKIPPSSFERLCQRLLRELGFKNVEVTGKPNDGGIDGKGILRLGGILSFHVVFQAKRYKDTVGSEIIRNFRGSLSAKIDKGLIISTGRFTVEAKKEAQRDGAIPIDLIDGEELVEKLKELKLGINTMIVEKVSVDSKWFDSI